MGGGAIKIEDRRRSISVVTIPETDSEESESGGTSKFRESPNSAMPPIMGEDIFITVDFPRPNKHLVSSRRYLLFGPISLVVAAVANTRLPHSVQ